MKINGTVYCMFEQSGTFKNEFKKLGINAIDMDIQNNFGETDYVIDLFAEIKKGYEGKPSIFDDISKDDLIVAFFPCTYFEALQMTTYQLTSINQRAMSYCEKIKSALERLEKRSLYHTILYKFVWVAEKKGLRLIIENPATMPHYLIGTQNFPTPTIIDKNRMNRGDFYKKPTAYWYFGCEPTYGESYQNDKEQKTIMGSKNHNKDTSTEERSMISSDYARNFICDFILGKEQKGSQMQLFNFEEQKNERK